jgi:hypothetical protein
MKVLTAKTYNFVHDIWNAYLLRHAAQSGSEDELQVEDSCLSQLHEADCLSDDGLDVDEDVESYEY